MKTQNQYSALIIALFVFVCIPAAVVAIALFAVGAILTLGIYWAVAPFVVFFGVKERRRVLASVEVDKMEDRAPGFSL